jgi:hypothetical protein
MTRKEFANGLPGKVELTPEVELMVAVSVKQLLLLSLVHLPYCVALPSIALNICPSKRYSSQASLCTYERLAL